jgi:surface protein
LNIVAGNKIEIHFTIPPNELDYFFSTTSDNQVKNIVSIDLSNLDTSSVTSMVNMFNGCKSLESINLSNFDTSKVTNMNHLFNGCSSLKSIDLSNFDTSKVTNKNNMFNECSSLKYIKLYRITEETINFQD